MRKMMLIFTVLLAAGCSYLQNVRTPGGIIRPFDGFAISGDIESYSAMNLKNLLPNDAPAFVEFGVDSSWVAQYDKGNSKYSVEVYSFLNGKGAFGTYYLMEPSGSEPLSFASKGRKSLKTVEFAKGLYYVRIQPLGGADINGAIELAGLIEKRITGSVLEPDLFSTLPRNDIVKNTELYFNGPRAFLYRFPPDLCKGLFVEYAREGVAAIYSFKGYEAELIKLRFNGRKETLEALNNFLDQKRIEKLPILHTELNPVYYIVVEKDQSETYLAENGEILVVVTGGQKDGQARSFFEYTVRSIR
jgi:hypothetical protein